MMAALSANLERTDRMNRPALALVEDRRRQRAARAGAGVDVAAVVADLGRVLVGIGQDGRRMAVHDVARQYYLKVQEILPDPQPRLIVLPVERNPRTDAGVDIMAQ